VSLWNRVGGALVPGPTTATPKFSLFSAVELEDNVASGHWEGGIQYETDSCAPIDTTQINCPPQDIVKDPSGGNINVFESGAFAVLAGYKCGTVGRPAKEAFDIAERRLRRNEIRAVEEAFYTGLDGQGNLVYPSLRQAPAPGPGDPAVLTIDDLTPVAGALSISGGLAALEAYAGGFYPSVPVLHIPRGLAVHLAERGLVNADLNTDTLTSTATGTPIVAGGGYGVTGPDGSSPTGDDTWMYITGAMKIMRSEVFFTPHRDESSASIDRVLNDVTVYAERTYAIEIDCEFVAAVRVLATPCCP